MVVENLQIDGDDTGGAPPDVEIGVLLVDTRRAKILNNTVGDTLLGAFVRGNSLAYFDLAIQEGTPDSNIVLDNDMAQIPR